MNKDITVTLDLVRRAQGGENACKDRLIRRYYSRVRRIVRMRMDSRLRRHVDTCDILQETFVAAMSAFDNFDMHSESSFINWMSVIAERKIRDAVDHATAQRRDVKREVSMNQTCGADTGSFAASLAEEKRSPLSVMAIDEDTETLEELIRALPPQQREVILLRNYAGSSWDEIAEEMHKSSADAARMLHARAMVELSKRVQKRS